MRDFSTSSPSIVALHGPEEIPATLNGREVWFFKPDTNEVERFMAKLSRDAGSGDIWNAAQRLVENMLSSEETDDEGLTDFEYVTKAIEESGRYSLWMELAEEAMEEFIGRPLAQSSGSRAQRRRSQRSSQRTLPSTESVDTTATRKRSTTSSSSITQKKS